MAVPSPPGRARYIAHAQEAPSRTESVTQNSSNGGSDYLLGAALTQTPLCCPLEIGDERGRLLVRGPGPGPDPLDFQPCRHPWSGTRALGKGWECI